MWVNFGIVELLHFLLVAPKFVKVSATEWQYHSDCGAPKERFVAVRYMTNAKSRQSLPAPGQLREELGAESSYGSRINIIRLDKRTASLK